MNRDAEIERAARALWEKDRYGWQNDAGSEHDWKQHDTNGAANYRAMATAAITPLLDRIETLEPVWALREIIARVTLEPSEEIVERIATALRDESDRQLNAGPSGVQYPPSRVEDYLDHARAIIKALETK